MPIHLPPLSRRRFLNRTIAAGAGLILSPKLFAASRKVDEHCWALISDIHIAADRSKVARGVNMTENFEATVKEILALKKNPAAALICGDLAFSSGEKGDYENMMELLRPLRAAQMPVHLVLGNHDHRERFWDALQGERSAKRPLQDRHASIIRTPRANWFVLDSLDETLSIPGVLGEGQLSWLAKSLDANANKPALVVVHHNPDEREKVGGLVETKKLFAVMRPRKQVKALFFGHTHIWSVQEDPSGIHLVNLPTTAYRFNPAYPNGWVMANLEKRGMRLELRCLDHQHDENERVVNLEWRA